MDLHMEGNNTTVTMDAAVVSNHSDNTTHEDEDESSYSSSSSLLLELEMVMTQPQVDWSRSQELEEAFGEEYNMKDDDPHHPQQQDNRNDSHDKDESDFEAELVRLTAAADSSTDKRTSHDRPCTTSSSSHGGEAREEEDTAILPRMLLPTFQSDDTAFEEALIQQVQQLDRSTSTGTTQTKASTTSTSTRREGTSSLVSRMDTSDEPLPPLRQQRQTTSPAVTIEHKKRTLLLLERVDSSLTSPTSNKKLRQVTLSQSFSKQENNTTRTTLTHASFSRTQPYKEGQTWRSTKTFPLMGDQQPIKSPYFFTILKIDWKLKRAHCSSVEQYLTDTYIGEDAARELERHWNTSRQTPQKVICGNTQQILKEGKWIPFYYLNDLIETTPLPELIYERGIVLQNADNNCERENDGDYAAVAASRSSSNKKRSKPKTSSSNAINLRRGGTLTYKSTTLANKIQLQDGEKPVTLDLFAGCGGASLGFQLAGFDPKYKVECDPHACDSLNLNFRDSIVFPEQVQNFLHSCQTRRTSRHPQPGDVHHIHASPPCDGYSKVNTGEGQNDEYNNRVSRCFTEAVRFFQPHVASMENVVAMQDLTKNKRNHLNRIVKDLLGIDYQVRLCVLRASNYGDAQHRDRFFLIASKIGVPLPDFPPATHATEYEWVSVQEAIGDLADISPHAGVIELADGTLVTDHVEFGVLPDGGTHNKSQVLKLNSDTPAGTVRRSNVIQHYSHNRVLTIRERARLQSFPSSFRFAGTPTQQAAQIGNAVPIYLARAVARAIREACFSFDATASTTSMR